ncbi:Hypothetical protein ZAZAV_193 [Cedratvirus Zaza IHUMI]|uniref:Uncharacterized protein n=1 Tax=Cedratvirus Zaza IHUMI TaxID=2126979 RepID=A0A2R8FDS4_9VIRU|nr:Hypothetical protein ZAZAV_193 [Cedratvirus Zaza IHUMI]
MARSLYSTVLHNYSYSELKDLCFAPGSTFGSAFDCQWGVWRDKAVADFGVSREFFDLVRSFGIRVAGDFSNAGTLSGPQRYLQIASYVKLTPLSGVRVYDDETCPCFIEGVYEALTGFAKAISQRDLQMLLWFNSRIKPEQKEEIKSWMGQDYEDTSQIIQRLEKEWTRAHEQLTRPSLYDRYYLERVLLRGRLDILDQIIHSYFVLPEEFSIEKDITRYYRYGDNPLDEPFPIYELPLQTTEDEDVKEIVSFALLSSDVRIVDFFRSIFRDRDLRDITKNLQRPEQVLFHGKPEEAYQIGLRFMQKDSKAYLYSYMVELLLQTKDEGDYAFILDEKAGDIPYITCLLPHVIDELKSSNSPLQEFAYISNPVLYPVSHALLQEALQ